MDVASYAKKKEKNTVKLQKLSKNVYQMIAIRYDADTGEEIDPETQQFTVDDIDKTISEATRDLVLIQKRIENLELLKQDMKVLP